MFQCQKSEGGVITLHTLSLGSWHYKPHKSSPHTLHSRLDAKNRHPHMQLLTSLTGSQREPLHDL